jgi:hypothetical protein
MRSAGDLRLQLRELILRHAQRIPPDGLTDTTPLVGGGVLSSLQVVEVLLWIEQVTGAPVDVTRLGPGDFRNVDTIHARFLAAHEAPLAGGRR